MALVMHKTNKRMVSASFPSIANQNIGKTHISSNSSSHNFPDSSPKWLKGGGTTVAPTKNPVRRTFSDQLPAVSRVRSQTYNGNHEATKREIRSNPGARNGGNAREPRRKSNSAPNLITAKQNIRNGPTNHDRNHGGTSLPKINNYLTGGISTQSKHFSDAKNKRWASSWADARAHQPTLKSEDNGIKDANKTSPRSTSQESQYSTQKSTDKTQCAKTTSKNFANKLQRASSYTDGSNRKPLISYTSDYDDLEPELDITNSSQERKSISNVNQKHYGDQDKFIDSQITNVYATSAVHANTVRIGGFVDYESVGQTTYSKLAKSKDGTKSRSTSQASSSTDTSKRGVSFRPTPKWKKPVVLTKKTRKQERSLNSVYDNKTYKVQRKASILKKMESMEKKQIEDYNRNLETNDKKLKESIMTQRQTLKKVRDKFDDDQVQRFKRQYVSWKSVENERLKGTRESYGLPDNIYDDRYDRTLKEVKTKDVKAKKKTFKQYASWVKNIKRFESMLNPSILGNPESMKKQMPVIVEGIDTVQITNKGLKSPKKAVRVRNVIGSAKRILSAADDDDDDIDTDLLGVDNGDGRRISMISGLTDLSVESDLSLSDDDDEEY